MAKKTLIDRKRPDVALATLNDKIESLMSDKNIINKKVIQIIETAESLDENYYAFKESVETFMTTMSDFVSSVETHENTTESNFTDIAGVFSAEDFRDQYLDTLKDNIESFGIAPSDSTPNMNGVGSAGVSDNYSRNDHVHPSEFLQNFVETTPPIRNTNATDVAGGYVTIGNLVIVNISFTVNVTFNANDYFTMFTDMPIPIRPAALSVANYNSGWLQASGYVYTNGRLIVQSSDTALTNKTLYVSGIYIKS